jgi:CHAT domain-containing protein/tetratricopeptide (TPR) repeat protein
MNDTQIRSSAASKVDGMPSHPSAAAQSAVAQSEKIQALQRSANDTSIDDLQSYLSESPGQEHIRFHRILASAQATRDLALIRRLLSIVEPLLPDHPVLRQWYVHTLGYLALEADNQIEQAATYQQSLLAEGAALDPDLQGRVLIELGAIYERLDRWDKALRCYEDCLILYEARGNQAALAVTLCNMAILHYKAQNYAAAVECARRSIELLEQSQDSPSKRQALCAVWSQLGETYLRQGKLSEAEAALNNSVAICERSNRHFCQGVPYDNLGHVYRLMGQFDKAERYYQLARTVSNELGNIRDAAEATYGLGLLRMQSGEAAQDALALFDQALEAANASDNYELAIQVHLRRADLYERAGQMESALSETERAVTMVESLRANIALPEDRLRMTAARAEAYEQAVGRLYRAYREAANYNKRTPELARAFRYAEMSKSRALIEMLTGRPVRPPTNVPQAWLDQQAELRQALHGLYRNSRANAAQIEKLEAQLNRLRERIRLRAAEFESFNTVDPLALEDAQARMPDDAVLLEYFASGDELLTFVVTSRDAQIVPAALKPRELQRAFTRLDDRFGPVHGVMPDVHRRLSQPWMLNKLYQRLIEPLGSTVTEARTLCIVPHGMLHYIPFHALYRRPTNSNTPAQFLAFHDGDRGEPREIIYAPSATVLFDYCQSKPISTQKGCLTLGYNGATLIHAEAEARAVADVVGGTWKVGLEATRSALFNEGPRYRYLHLSCHGWFNSVWPTASALAMADGELDVADVLQHLRLDAELVSLSACETGRSQVLRGDELIGMTRAFLYAGSPSVIVSQWLIDDLSSCMFMRHFYQKLMHSSDRLKARAVGQAQYFIKNLSLDALHEMMIERGIERRDVDWQLKALAYAAGFDDLKQLRGHERLFDHPYYWAAFFIIGDRL